MSVNLVVHISQISLSCWAVRPNLAAFLLCCILWQGRASWWRCNCRWMSAS